MYRNEIKKEYNKDYTNEELDELYAVIETFDPKIKIQLSEHFSEQIAYYIALWFKYFRKENTTYNRIASSAFDYPKFTKKEEEKYLKRSKAILKARFGIEVVSDNPMILSSDVPFEDIEV